MTYDQNTAIDVAAIELQARRMRAQAMRDGVKALGAWLHAAFARSGKHA